MVTIYIDTEKVLEEFCEKANKYDVFIIAIPTSMNTFYVDTKISVLSCFIREIDTQYIFILDHPERLLDSLFPMLNTKIYTWDKKQLLHYGISGNIYDLRLLSYLNGHIIETPEFRVLNIYKSWYRNVDAVIKTIPVSKIAEYHRLQYRLLLDAIDSYDINNSVYQRYNTELIDVLHYIESSGIKINRELFINTFTDNTQPINKDGIVYTEYNIYTATGRPSNSYGNVNYAALSKKDNSRDCIISRFNNGKLVELDFESYHLRLISNLINFDFSLKDNIHEYFATYYFNKPVILEEEYTEAKGITFRQLYGNIDKNYESIPFFYEYKKYIYNITRQYLKNGYIESPIYKRKIQLPKEEYRDTKLINYLIQLHETERNISKLYIIINELKNKYRSKMMLYTYDSILLDIHPDEGYNYIEKIVGVLTDDGQYPIKMKIGDNYKDMKLIL